MRGESPREDERIPAHDLLLRALSDDRSRLKSVRSIEEKARLKVDMLPKYLAWVDGVLAAWRGGQDPVVTHAMVWSLDIGEFAQALRIGAYVLHHNLHMPDQYDRNAATVIADGIADAMLKALAIGQPTDLDVIRNALALIAGHDVHDQVRAKLHKAIGLSLLPPEIPKDYADDVAAPILEALGHLQRAFELSTQSGVKKPLERAQAYAAAYERAVAAREQNTMGDGGGTGDRAADGEPPAVSGDSAGGGQGSPPPVEPTVAP